MPPPPPPPPDEELSSFREPPPTAPPPAAALRLLVLVRLGLLLRMVEPCRPATSTITTTHTEARVKRGATCATNPLVITQISETTTRSLHGEWWVVRVGHHVVWYGAIWYILNILWYGCCGENEDGCGRSWWGGRGQSGVQL